MSTDGAAGKAAGWQEQQRDDDGTHLAGAAGLPANHRLRAERLAVMRRKTDPDGIISDELIADTAARLKRESAEAKDNNGPGAAPAGGGE